LRQGNSSDTESWKAKLLTLTERENMQSSSESVKEGGGGDMNELDSKVGDEKKHKKEHKHKHKDEKKRDKKKKDKKKESKRES